MARQGYRVPLFLALMCLASVCYAAPDKVTLAYKAKAGQVARYKSEGTMSFEAGGNKMTGEIKETEKVTVAEVAASGNITLERETESSEVTFNGQRAPSMDSDKTKITMTIRPDGSLVAYKSSSGKEEQDKSRRICSPRPRPCCPISRWAWETNGAAISSPTPTWGLRRPTPITKCSALKRSAAWRRSKSRSPIRIRKRRRWA